MVVKTQGHRSVHQGSQVQVVQLLGRGRIVGDEAHAELHDDPEDPDVDRLRQVVPSTEVAVARRCAPQHQYGVLLGSGRVPDAQLCRPHSVMRQVV